MKFRRFIAYHDGKKFIMEDSVPDRGVYLYILSDDKCIYDYLQDTFEICKKFANEDFGVPLNGWKEIEPVEWINGKRIDPLNIF